MIGMMSVLKVEQDTLAFLLSIHRFLLESFFLSGDIKNQGRDQKTGEGISKAVSIHVPQVQYITVYKVCMVANCSSYIVGTYR